MTQYIDRNQEELMKLNELIKDIRFAMLTTVDDDGKLYSRPMATTLVESDGDLWFVTDRNSGKVEQIKDNSHVNVAYANPDDTVFVSVSGRATLTDDPDKVAEIWSPAMKAWFPKGKDDPRLVLLKVDADSAEYWDMAGGLTQILAFAKAFATGERLDNYPGENKRIDLA